MNHGHSRVARAAHVLALLFPIAGVGCTGPSRQAAVPRELQDQATVLNSPGIRTWGNLLTPAFEEETLRSAKREMELREKAGETGPLPPAYFLAISGGGADGAYGAGLLCGWTASGKRPEFKVVTGVSTGALTAPFAFLGPKYDEKMKKVYTTVTTRQIAKPRGMLAALFDDALMDTAPLRKLMGELIDEQMINDIAAEYARGRLLLVGTTNLDASRGVIWNVTAIAASGDPGARNLILDILRASAAIPAAFPPVMIDVEAGGKQYQEMHVDGGARAQVFLYPPSLALRSVAEAHGIKRDRVGYIIRNARLDSNWADTQRRTLPIAGRAISSLIQTQGVGDLYRIYLTCQRDGVDYNLAYIPSTFEAHQVEDFDPVYMSQLFDVGFEAAKKGYTWEKRPPAFADENVVTTPSEPGPTGPK